MTSEKQTLIFGTETFVCNCRVHRFPVVLDQVCTHCRRDFGPLLHTDLSPDPSGVGAVAGQYGLSAPSKDFQLGSGMESG